MNIVCAGLRPVGLDRLKVNLRLSVGGAFHLDTIDLYQARARSNFAQTAAKLCRVEESHIAADLLSLIESLERARLEMKKTSANDEAGPMTASEKEAALVFLQSPNLCERIVEDFKRCGFKDERETVLTAYLSAVSRKLPDPLCALVVARSGAGKSALQDAVCDLTPPGGLVRVTRLSGQALFYKDPDSLKQKLLLTTAALSRALDELAPPVRGMYEEFRRLCEARAVDLRCKADEVQLTRREIREATGWSDWQVRVYCQQLVELEYLSTASGANGKRFVYELAFYRSEGDGPPKLRGLVDVSELRRKQFGRLKEKSERRATNLVAKK